uniref:Uncharacterized protein LOC117369233 n=1 Tax=Geotrypetes seraphini TaxID=260995 RepID=A0A6P8STE9_GEOSA|nr:uncharacterized protein LOC117369233 [Geotrypetes seraphini]XP_033819366.1 uncharacterized protein LOC117369233 [Geotrypetes seraphini]XP_033819367.1 uncharacterized protein LOC117369233 [Geotrypetes seraphini]XP_033819368.1 uncharacterized protein LOC117369233 [Geotrypetes seraphini]
MTECKGRKDAENNPILQSLHQPFGCEEANLWVPPAASHSLRKILSEQHGKVTEQKTLKVKRRRTKRERDNAKFGKISKSRSVGTVSRMYTSHPDFHHSVPGPSSAVVHKSTYVSNPVVITQNRLTQHLGIFNREVKSADIGRLLSQELEIERSAAGKSSETEKDVGEGFSNTTKASLLKEIKMSHLQLEKRESGSSSQTVIDSSLVLENFSQCPGTADLQAKGTEHLHTPAFPSGNGKENKPPQGTEPWPLKVPVKELAADLAAELNLHTVFPGRYFLGEAQKVIFSLLLNRHGKIPDVSEFALRQKLGYSSNPRSSQATSCVEPRTFSEADNKGVSSRNQGESAYRKRRRKQRFPRHFSMSPATTPAHVLTKLVAEKPTQKNGLDLFEELKIYGHPGLCFTATAYPEIPVQNASHSRPPVLRSDLPQSTGFITEGLEEHFPAGMSWVKSCESEKNKEDCEQSQKRNETHQYHVPFLDRDCTAAASDLVAHDHKLFQNFQAFTYPQHLKCGQVLSPKMCGLEKEHLRESLLGRRQGHIAKNSFVFRDTQSLEGTASDVQTSFDVLKSIWNSDIHTEGTAKVSVSKTSDCSCLNKLIPSHCSTSYRGMCPGQRHLKNILKLCTEKRYPSHTCPVHVLNNEASAQKYMTSRPKYTTKSSLNGAADRACHHEVSLPPPCMTVDQNGTQQWLESWEDKLPLTRSRLFTSQQEHSGKSHCGIEDCFCALKPRSFLKQNPQLPLAFFPPSEALEHTCSLSPYSTSYESSPEAWVFPRMKLY